jgi:hypothetical protein
VRYRVTIALETTVRDEELEQRLDRLYEQLLDSDLVDDPDIAASIAKGTVHVVMSVDADSDLVALTDALVAVRTAIHELGDIHADLARGLEPGQRAVQVEAEHLEPAGT